MHAEEPAAVFLKVKEHLSVLRIAQERALKQQMALKGFRTQNKMVRDAVRSE